MSVPCPMSPGSTSCLPHRAAGTPGTSPGGPSSLHPQAGEHQPAPAWSWAASSHPLLPPPPPPQGDVGDLGLPGAPGPKVLCLGWVSWEGGPTCIADWRQGCCLGGHLAPEWGGGCWYLGSSQTRAVPQLKGAWSRQPPPGCLLGSRQPHLALLRALPPREAGRKAERGVLRHRRGFAWGGFGCPHPTGKHLIFCASLSCRPARASFCPASPRVEVKACWDVHACPPLPWGPGCPLG